MPRNSNSSLKKSVIPHNHFVRYKTSDEVVGDNSYMFPDKEGKMNVISLKPGINIVDSQVYEGLIQTDTFKADLVDGVVEDVATYENTVEGILELPKDIKLKVISEISYRHIDFLVSWQATDKQMSQSIANRIRELEAKRELQVIVSAKKLY